MTEGEKLKSERGDRLRQARKSLGITQQAMADKIGIQRPSYNQIENGRAGIADDTQSVLAELNINLNWIITGKGDMFLKEPDPPEAESHLMEEMEERVRRIRLDVSDIEDTLKKMLGRKK